MIEKLKSTNCFYPLEKGIYFIYDNDVKNEPDFVTEIDRWNLKLENNSLKIVNFFQNDGCLMKQNELKKCDWICYFENEFYFIEAKDVKKKNRKLQRNDAVAKFDATIPYFLDLYPSIKTMRLIVIMNFRSSKITNAANKAKAAYFDQEYDAEYREVNFLKFN